MEVRACLVINSRPGCLLLCVRWRDEVITTGQNKHEAGGEADMTLTPDLKGPDDILHIFNRFSAPTL
ncbi:hypothetical protein PoB_005188100 [Plakobranchus ocellatus]|uniref:Uncharacterized protein n=1 Tax=Plakobranchus ocellatus TaxID=259542 RepID=A0AAV4BQ70_9GAST|nr:hypothetical protein PoB_005188100 [Plakobranchus ocellatus]